MMACRIRNYLRAFIELKTLFSEFLLQLAEQKYLSRAGDSVQADNDCFVTGGRLSFAA
jgi:hypothetical protein